MAALAKKESHPVSERVLQKYHFRLRKELDVPILLPYLIKYHLITADVHEELTLQTTNATKVDKLVAELPRSGEHFLERFIECLRESEKDEPGTPHKQIADTLEEELRCQNVPGYSSSSSTTIATAPADDRGCSQRKLGKGSRSVSERILRKCRFKLRRELNVPTLLPYLNKYRLITADVYEELTLQSTNATKVERLVAELPRSGEDFLERFIKCLRHSAKEEPGTCHEQIADILEEEAKCQNSQENVTSGSVQITMSVTCEHSPLLVQHGHPCQPNLIATSSVRLYPRNLNAAGLKLTQICCNKWCYCYTTIALVTVLLLLPLIILSQIPRISYVHPESVYRNSTAKLQFDYMPWLYYAEIALNSSGCYSPQGQLYVIRDQDCSNLPNVTTNYVDNSYPVDHVYMRPGSTINFTVSPAATGLVWLLPDYSYREYKKNPTGFNCQHKPAGAYCFEASNYLNKSHLYSITQPAYYYIRTQPASFYITPNKHNYNQSYDRVLFNVAALPPSATVTKLSSEFTPITFRKPFTSEKTCVLLNIPSSCSTPINVLVSNVSRGEDVLIYPAIPPFICLVFFFILLFVHVYMYCYRNRMA